MINNNINILKNNPGSNNLLGIRDATLGLKLLKHVKPLPLYLNYKL